MVQLGAGNTIITPKDLLIDTCALLHFFFFFFLMTSLWKPEVSGTLVFSGMFSGLLQLCIHLFHLVSFRI